MPCHTARDKSAESGEHRSPYTTGREVQQNRFDRTDREKLLPLHILEAGVRKVGRQELIYLGYVVR